MQPLVSILVAAYNAEPWIAETLASILDQTWQNIEVIVVDDGSIDQTLAIAQSFPSKTVKVIHQPNRGASSARNRALQEAQGEYLQYLDADDLLTPNKIASQMALLQRNAVGTLAVCNTIHFFDGMNPDEGIYYDGDRYYTDSDEPVNWLIQILTHAMVPVSSWLTPRAIAEAAGNWNEALSVDDDGEYFTRVVLASAGIRYSREGFAYYRKYHNGCNLSASRSEKHFQSALHALDLKTKYLGAYTNDLNEQSAKRAMACCYQKLAVLAYPQWESITNVALQRVRELGGTDVSITLGGWQLELIKSLLGWKIARRVSTWRQQWRQMQPG